MCRFTGRPPPLAEVLISLQNGRDWGGISGSKLDLEERMSEIVHAFLAGRCPALESEGFFSKGIPSSKDPSYLPLPASLPD